MYVYVCVGQLAAGKILFAAGESGTEMFFLVDGQMDVRTGRKPHNIRRHSLIALRLSCLNDFRLLHDDRFIQQMAFLSRRCMRLRRLGRSR